MGLSHVFCDINPVIFTKNVNKIEELITDKTLVIIFVHLYENICGVEEKQRIADKYGLAVFKDSCHAFGEKYNGNRIN